MIARFSVRHQAAAEFGHRSSSGPVGVLAQSLHARLYGLPADPGPLPTALDELLQSTYTATETEQQAAVLVHLAEQLHNAAQILEWARDNAHWRRLPGAWEWLREATTSTRQIADGLATVSTAFTTGPAPTVPATPPTPPPLGSSRPAPRVPA
ncbi:hypothetical protein ACFYT4_16635 [Streptomyces sp. NPDC004609]|uniref:hypothetical protein n=1 Tax=Streptomyces sp. NPDC004609 TaxID=3364704 RepID=UPI003685D284